MTAQLPHPSVAENAPLRMGHPAVVMWNFCSGLGVVALRSSDDWIFVAGGRASEFLF